MRSELLVAAHGCRVDRQRARPFLRARPTTGSINSSSREIPIERSRSGKSGQRSRPLSCRQHIDWRGDTVTFSTPKEEAPHGGSGASRFLLRNKVMEGGIPITNRGIWRARDKHKSSLLIRMIRLTYQWWPETQAEADALRAALRSKGRRPKPNAQHLRDPAPA